MDHAKAIKQATDEADELAANAKQARARRDKIIRTAASKGGMSVRAIAAAAGKSHGWAGEILKRKR